MANDKMIITKINCYRSSKLVLALTKDSFDPAAIEAIKQLGDDQLPNELTNFANQAQNARWTLSNWQAADAAVDRMIIDATDGLGQP